MIRLYKRRKESRLLRVHFFSHYQDDQQTNNVKFIVQAALLQPYHRFASTRLVRNLNCYGKSKSFYEIHVEK
jgi:hypothetical protein